MPYNRLNKGIANTFDIVTAPFCDFNGNKEFAMFLILYKESLDDSVADPHNVIGVKLTSRATVCGNDYRILLRRKDCPFLNKDSYITLNHLHTLREKDCVFVSELPNKYKELIMIGVKNLTYELDVQLILDANIGKDVK